MDSKEETRIKVQAKSYIQSAAEVFYQVLQKSTPLDRELKHFFRMHPECGSNDRQIISESCFSLFRWYGWVRTCLPGGLPAKPYESHKFCKGLAAALWLDGHDQLAFFPHLLELANVDDEHMESASSHIKEKIKGVGHFFHLRKLDIVQLIPEWFIATLPNDTNIESFIDFLQIRPPVWIRVQNKMHDQVRRQLDEYNVDLSEHPCAHNAFKIESNKFKATQLSSYESGGFEIQDLASQCVGLSCEVQRDKHWWDVCAGAGGKSLLLADHMKGFGQIIATDIREGALKHLEMRAKRAGFENIKVSSLADVCQGSKLFDGVLVDAPCSCTGVWRRNPDLRWTTGESEPLKYAQTQLEIIQMAAPKVKEGGMLVYATCSVCMQENEKVVEAFLERNKDFQLERFANPLNGEKVEGMLRINFDDANNDGMFVARMKRKSF